jgi:hypothetical protein
MTPTVVNRFVLAAALFGTAALSAGCGGAEASTKQPPPKVPIGLVPASLNDGAFAVIENQSARKQFSAAPKAALITDGRLWGIRRGQQLVATLQIATFKAKVDASDEAQRKAIISQIAAGATQNITVGSVDVAENLTPNAAVYIWFGKDLFEVLQVKLSKQAPVDPEALLNDIVAYQTAQPSWHGLPRSAQ